MQANVCWSCVMCSLKFLQGGHGAGSLDGASCGLARTASLNKPAHTVIPILCTEFVPGAQLAEPVTGGMPALIQIVSSGLG